MPNHVLLIQAEPHAATVVQGVLHATAEPAYTVEWVDTVAPAIEHLAGHDGPGGTGARQVAALIFDLSGPGSSALRDLARLLRCAPSIPVLVTCADDEESIARQAVRLGAQDYLLRSHIDGYTLPKALGGMRYRAATAARLRAALDRAQSTLNSIGDAVLTTDVAGAITYLNPVAEALTGWTRLDAAGRPVDEVFHIIDAQTRSAARSPMLLALDENTTVALTPNCLLIRRDGSERAVEDSAAPIHDAHGQLAGAVLVFRDVSEARAQAQRLSHLAQHDSLTGLSNRALLADRLKHAASLGHRNRRPFAVLFIDVDRFKDVNDALGHEVGDQLLQAVATRLLACVRDSDTVSRLGGDEFVVLLSEIGHARDAAVAAATILAALTAPLNIGGHALHVTASIGISTYPEDGREANALLDHADVAMYAAKQRGRNGWQFFSAAAVARIADEEVLGRSLQGALERHEFVLHFQPQINLATHQISGVEALLRWRHPDRGLLSPKLFLSTAEASGSMSAITDWIMAEACHHGRAWQRGSSTQVRVAVNVSAFDLRAPGFVDAVRAALDASGFAPDNLQIEIPDPVLLGDEPATRGVLQALKGVGVRLAIDDVGSGLASLDHLGRLPIDVLKVEQSYLLDANGGWDGTSGVCAALDRGEADGIQVVAKSVETFEQLTSLRNLGCTEAQGYYLARPMPAQDFANLLQRLGTEAVA